MNMTKTQLRQAMKEAYDRGYSQGYNEGLKDSDDKWVESIMENWDDEDDGIECIDMDNYEVGD